MHILLISAQDISKISIAVADNNKILYERESMSRPESYLHTIELLLKEWGIDLKDINKIFVVSGPGSFTATRVSVMIANSLAFSKNISVFSKANEKNRSLRELFSEIIKENEDTYSLNTFVVPTYDRGARITQSKNN